MRVRPHLFPCLLALVLAACGRDGGPAPAVATAPAASTAAALAPELQAIYDRSCASCHSIPASGAPQLGDRQAWAPRLAQGADVLLEHTVTGYKAMPPLGACMDCDEEQFRALIAHLAGAEAQP